MVLSFYNSRRNLHTNMKAVTTVWGDDTNVLTSRLVLCGLIPHLHGDNIQKRGTESCIRTCSYVNVLRRKINRYGEPREAPTKQFDSCKRHKLKKNLIRNCFCILKKRLCALFSIIYSPPTGCCSYLMYKCSTIEKNSSTRNHTEVKEAHLNTEAKRHESDFHADPGSLPPENSTVNRHYTHNHKCKKREVSPLPSASPVTFAAENSTS